MVVWLIGLSGSGKTTLAEEVVQVLRNRRRNVVLIDGDGIREVFGGDVGYDMHGRKVNADRICRLCAYLDSQGVDVVCAILSLFPESREWCRAHLTQYYEIFIDTPLDILRRRDSKGLYARYDRGEIRDVAGLDLEFIRPLAADLVIVNSGSLVDFLPYATTIADRVCGVTP